MIKTSIMLAMLLSSLIGLAQQRAIEITDRTSGKIIMIKENKRVKVKTVQGKTISGRFRIAKDSVLIGKVKLGLNEMAEIKRDPLLTTLLLKGFFVYVGSVTIALGVVMGALVDSTAYWLLLPGTGMLYLGMRPISIGKSRNRAQWNYRLVSITGDDTSLIKGNSPLLRNTP
jgi:hypothetical protein